MQEQAANEHVYAVILAGGSGTRFWPKSRHLKPKQLCKMGDQPATMLELTLKRLDGFIPPERRMIVTHHEQLASTRALAQAGCRHFLAEPEAKNTANALALAALQIEHLAGPRAVMISLHADSMIKDEVAFRASLRTATALAEKEHLVLLGIEPEYAETGYGYIERGPSIPGMSQAFKVASFREKPERRLAEEYVASGRFCWNAGMFTWRVDVLLEELTRTLKPSVDALRAVLAQGGGKGLPGVAFDKLHSVYKSLPKISIDHAVLEVSQRVAVVAAAFGWQDVGSWDALSRTFQPDGQGNLLFGDGCLIDTTGTTVDSDGAFVAALGMKDTVIVASGGAILVCPKERSQEVKKIVEWLDKGGRKDLL